MRLLLDTHVFLWLEQNPRELSPVVLAALQDPENTLYLSAASIWEISTKRKKGILKFDGEVQSVAARYGLIDLPISWLHAETAGSLPMLHRDPFDRMLIAQTQIERLILVTTDAEIRKYSVAVF